MKKRSSFKMVRDKMHKIKVDMKNRWLTGETVLSIAKRYSTTERNVYYHIQPLTAREKGLHTQNVELKHDQIFLILSNNPKTKDTQKLSIRNLFFSRSGGLLSIADVTKLWESLAKNNFIIHPALEAKHYQNKICIWCGGEITKLTGLEEENWEARCRSCGYLYDDQK